MEVEAGGGEELGSLFPSIGVHPLYEAMGTEHYPI